MALVDLHWQGPFFLLDPTTSQTIDSDPNVQGGVGVYLWCFWFKGEYRVWYVGKSEKDLVGRLMREIDETLTGYGRILDTDVLENQGTFEELYKPRAGRKMEFFRDYLRLAPHAYWMLSLVQIFVALTDPGLCHRIESALIRSLKTCPEATCFRICNVQNGPPNRLDPIEIHSQFDQDISVVGLQAPIKY